VSHPVTRSPAARAAFAAQLRAIRAQVDAALALLEDDTPDADARALAVPPALPDESSWTATPGVIVPPLSAALTQPDAPVTRATAEAPDTPSQRLASRFFGDRVAKARRRGAERAAADAPSVTESVALQDGSASPDVSADSSPDAPPAAA